MNNSTCSVCGRRFEMGVDGIYAGKDDKCDSCAGIVRLPNGEAYDPGKPYELRRPVASAFMNAAGPRPGDYVVTHPNRKKG